MPVFGTTAVKKTKPLLPSLKTPVTSPLQRRTKPADFNDLSEALRFKQKVENWPAHPAINIDQIA